MRKNNVVLAASLLAVGLVFTSCFKDKNGPGYEYMPDMYRSPAYKSGESNPNYDNGINNQKPVDGTIAHSFDPSKVINFMPYPFPDTEEGRVSATALLKNPLQRNESNVTEGKRLYEIYCAPCHGKTGMGDGSVVKVLQAKDNYGLAPVAYNSDQLKTLSEGGIFHTTQFGKNNMGPYAAQMTAEERWKVVFYVQDLQKGGAPAASDSTGVSTTDSTATAKK